MSTNLGDFLECSVCLETLGLNHKVLPCQHTFCLPCLEDIEKKKQRQKAMECSQGQADVSSLSSSFLDCPECRAPCMVPLTQLPSNVILNRILEGMRKSSSSSSLGQPLTPTKPSLSSLTLKSERQTPTASSNIPGNLYTNPFLSMLDESANEAMVPESPKPELPPKPGQSKFPLTSSEPPVLPVRPAPVVPSKAGLQKNQTSQINKSQGSVGSSATTGHQIYKALYNYTPAKPDELPLKVNELYVVMEKCQDGWFKGKQVKGLRTGYFPGNFVLHIGSSAQSSQSGLLKAQTDNMQPSKSETSLNKTDLNDDLIDLFSVSFDGIFGTDKAIIPPNASAVAVTQSEVFSEKHEAVQSKRAEEVKRLNAIANARKAVAPSNPLPRNPAGNLASNNQNFLNQSTPNLTTGSSSPTVTLSPPPSSQNNHPKFRCTMGFPASTEYELDLKEGDIVIMLKRRDDGWCKGKLERNGKVGLFPATFVHKIP